MIDFSDDIVVLGMTKRVAWLVALLGLWPILFFWYREYNHEKYLRSLAAENDHFEPGE